MYIRANVTADARRDRLEKAKDDSYTVTVRAPARGNQANERVRELVAKEFQVPVAQVRIFSGHRSRSKLLVIDK
jgi:uncharacterized protein YggU (UPF0235/DUF167 family)